MKECQKEPVGHLFPLDHGHYNHHDLKHRLHRMMRDIIDTTLTQFNTKSKIKYSSSSTNVAASTGYSISSFDPPRISRIRDKRAKRTLRSVSTPNTQLRVLMTSDTPCDTALQVIRSYGIRQIPPSLWSSVTAWARPRRQKQQVIDKRGLMPVLTTPLSWVNKLQDPPPHKRHLLPRQMYPQYRIRMDKVQFQWRGRAIRRGEVGLEERPVASYSAYSLYGISDRFSQGYK